MENFLHNLFNNPVPDFIEGEGFYSSIFLKKLVDVCYITTNNHFIHHSWIEYINYYYTTIRVSGFIFIKPLSCRHVEYLYELFSCYFKMRKYLPLSPIPFVTNQGSLFYLDKSKQNDMILVFRKTPTGEALKTARLHMEDRNIKDRITDSLCKLETMI